MANRRLAFLLSDMGRNQLAHQLTLAARDLYESGRHSDDDLIVFVEDVVLPPLVPPFCVLDIAEAFDYKGVAIATSLSTAEVLQRCVGPANKYFLVWDLEWMRGGVTYERAAAVYRSMKLVARTADHARAIARAWNLNVDHIAVVADGDLEGFLKLAERAR